VSPSAPAEEDFFLHVLEIGDKGATGKRRVELLDGVSIKGAAVESGPIILFGADGSEVETGEVSIPNIHCTSLIISSLKPETVYELNLGGLNVSDAPEAVLPGVSAGVLRLRTNPKGVLRVEKDLQNLRLRLSRV
jgi:hypothetical protein